MLECFWFMSMRKIDINQFCGNPMMVLADCHENFISFRFLAVTYLIFHIFKSTKYST